MNASTMNTKGINANPNASAAPAAWLLTASSSDPKAISPTRIDQKAGARISVATVIARHLRSGGSGSSPRLVTPSGGERSGH